MEKYTEKYKDYLYESLDDKLKDKLKDDYITLKRGILLLLEESIENTEELVDVQNFINKSAGNLNDNPLIGFVEDGEIFDFYLKYQNDINQICNNNGWFGKVPKEESIFSLYGYVINGSKFGVTQCLKIMEKELF